MYLCFLERKEHFFVNSKVYFQCSIILKAVKQIKATKGYWLVMLEHSSSQRIQRTRSSWLNCALRDDEAVYWVSIGHYEAVAVGN